MIFDKLSNIKNYKGSNKNLDTAIDYIMTHDLHKLPLGKTVLDGDQVYINVMDAVSAPLEERKYEIHHHYMDLQIDLAGIERIDTGDCTGIAMESYNAASDVGICSAPDLAQCIIGPGNFILCMAEEPHKPNIMVGNDSKLKKAVFKIHV